MFPTYHFVRTVCARHAGHLHSDVAFASSVTAVPHANGVMSPNLGNRAKEPHLATISALHVYSNWTELETGMVRASGSEFYQTNGRKSQDGHRPHVSTVICDCTRPCQIVE
jgi:hypothetical protein